MLQLFRRLSSEGMTETVENQLLSMSRHLKKIHRHRIGSDANKTASRIMDGKVYLFGYIIVPSILFQ